MNIDRELQGEEDLVLAGRLAIAYSLLVMAPYTEAEVSREGSPAQMAAYVIKTAKSRGNLGFLRRVME